MEKLGEYLEFLYFLIAYICMKCFIASPWHHFPDISIFHDTLNSILLKTISLKCTVLC